MTVPRPRRRAILIVDHGSRLAESNALLDEVARLVAAADPSYHVEAAHMELASPTIDEGFDACVAAGADEVVVLPYMLGPGRHATSDIPRLAASAAARHAGVRLRIAKPLGVDARLASLILSRVREAEEGRDHGEGAAR